MTTETGKHIVYFDDNEHMQMLYGDVLRSAGFRVTAVQDPADCVEQAATLEPDLVLMDVQMPGIDGFEATACLKSDKRTQGVPVFMLTSFGMDTERQRGLDAGAEEYLVKPFSPFELVKLVKKRLGDGG